MNLSANEYIEPFDVNISLDNTRPVLIDANGIIPQELFVVFLGGNPIDNLSGLPRHDDMEDVIVNPAEYYFDFTKNYNIEDFQFKVVPTPGHSIGGVSFIFDKEETVFSGDALFKETIGRWDLPTGNHEQLLTSIKEQLFTLPNHYRVFPGHGWDTTIGHEKVFNPHFS